VGFCYRKYPDDVNEAQSRDKVKSWELQEGEVDGEDPCYYKDQGGVNVLNRHQGKKGAKKKD
jgi:hypothetical protein